MSQNQNTETPPQDKEHTPSRGRFLNLVTLGAGGVIAFLLGVPVAGALLWPAVQKTSEVWRNVGGLDHFPIGDTTLVTFENAGALPWGGGANLSAAYVRRNGPADFDAFSVNCQHLGCAVQWRPQSHLFMCPCHGGMYYADGSVAVGPPLVGLQRYQVRVRKGVVEVMTRPFAWPY